MCELKERIVLCCMQASQPTKGAFHTHTPRVGCASRSFAPTACILLSRNDIHGPMHTSYMVAVLERSSVWHKNRGKVEYMCEHQPRTRPTRNAKNGSIWSGRDSALVSVSVLCGTRSDGRQNILCASTSHMENEQSRRRHAAPTPFGAGGIDSCIHSI